jgi:hypothetical protein
MHNLKAKIVGGVVACKIILFCNGLENYFKVRLLIVAFNNALSAV